ncbi:DUF7134 domain-containing protein [Bifidobacterium amazonense]
MARRLTTIRNGFARDRLARTLAVDALTALLAALAFVLMSGAGAGNMPGLLFSYDTVPLMAWSFVLALPLAFRRVRPQTAALAFVGLVAVQLVAGPSMTPSDFLALPMLYAVIVYGDPRNTRAFIVLAAAIGTLAGPIMSWALEAGPFFDPYVTPAEYAQADPGTIPDCRAVYAGGLFTGSCAQTVIQESAFYLAAILSCVAATVIAAFWQRARLITIRMMQERNEALEAGEAEERRIAALAERARIARDMHDVVAHTLSIIIVQSDGGRYAGAHDPAVARHTMETIRHESERALHDMKRLLGVFGGSDHADYADIDALVGQAKAAAAALADGSTVDRRVAGDVRPQLLGDAAGTAVYHLVQESLTNVRKYAGPNVHVRIDERWSDRMLEITVGDDGRGASSALDGHKPGYGLLGMRERIEAVGGAVAAGPRVGGGFEVRASVPLGGGQAGEASYDRTRMSAAEPAAPTTAFRTKPGSESESQNGRSEGFRQHGTTQATATEPSAYRSRPDETAYGRQSSPSTSTWATVPNAPDGTPRSASPATQGGRASLLPQIPTWWQLRERLRSKPIAQAVLANGEPFNWVERLSQWTERHYLAVDIIGTLLLIAIVGSSSLSLFDGYLEDTVGEQAVGRFIVITTMLPLCFRRRFPEGAALAVAVASAFQLVMFQPVLFANLFALVALHSAVLYGRPNAWRWTGVASAGIAALFGFKVALSNYGYASILHWMLRSADYTMTYGGVSGAAALSTPRILLSATTWCGAVGTMCMGTILLARWQRANGSNVLVLQAREEALRAEQAKQKVLAANMERDRISARIQSEVSRTLASVIDQAAAGIRMLDEAEARGEEPSAGAISAAFAAIGAQGRTALKHMRQLLSVLRETGFSDEAHEHAQPAMALRPAASLDEQLGVSARSRDANNEMRQAEP